MKQNQTIKKQRKYASHWECGDKLQKEKGVAKDWLDQSDTYHNLVCMPDRNCAPDFTIQDAKNNLIALEITELVDEKAVGENERDNRVYRDYVDKEEIECKLSKILCKKDQKKYHNGPYKKIIILIHTDEPMIQYEYHNDVIKDMNFTNFKQINEAFLLFSYHPKNQSYPCIKLNIK